MPSKRKRVASRQAQLSRRKRRDRTPRVPHEEIAPDRAGSSVPSGRIGADTGSGAASAVAERTMLPGQQQMRRNRPSRIRSEPLPSNTHLISELKHIGILTSLMAVALAVLTFVLR